MATLNILSRANILWVLLGIILFNASQLVSAQRLNMFFKRAGVFLSGILNVKLYYIGMFYNLLLPGGIGGDAFKGYLLKKRFDTKIRTLAGAMIADRATGLYAIFILLFILLLFELPSFLSRVHVLVLGIPGILAGILIFNKLFPVFKPVFLKTSQLSLLIQSFQLAAVWALLNSLSVNDHIIGYLIIFLVSSVATIVPVTVGGLGLREIVFLYGGRYFGLDPEIAVSVSLLFFMITVISSVPGLILHNQLKEADWNQVEST
jgi:hypothetical protein